MRNLLNSRRRIVVKVGTSILTSKEDRISVPRLERVASEVLSLLQNKKQVALVSSGAIAFGMQTAGLKHRPKSMAKLQAAAAMGQGKLMHAYETFFSRRGIHTAQLLLTRDGLETRKRFLAARNTFEDLFRMKTLPVVNENDTVATEEIAFGDNDVLSVQVAHLIHADLLVILSDVDGFYLKDGSRVREVTSEAEIDQQLVKHLQDKQKEKTVGGMRAKLAAARTAMRLGVPLVIVSGHQKGILEKLMQGEDVGTAFWAEKKPRSARKKWIAFSAPRKGTVMVDKGAYEALHRKQRSLLPGGIVRSRGSFERGDVVELETQEGHVFGRGVSRYSHKDLQRIAGKKTREIEAVLGYKYQDEAIHRSDLVIWS